MPKDAKAAGDKPLKAYKNVAFLNSPDARILRVMAEMLEPQSRLAKQGVRNTVVFFGSARTLPRKQALQNLQRVERSIRDVDPTSCETALEQARRDLAMSRYYEEAADLAEKLTIWFEQLQRERNTLIVCTGGGPGIMEAANLGASRAKGRSVGLNVSLPMEQSSNPYQSKELAFEFHYFFIRKFWFFYPARALIFFPGGFGTLDEFFELVTLLQTHKARKRMAVVLYGGDYWRQVVNFEAMVKWGTISPGDIELFRVVDNVDEAFAFIQQDLTQHFFEPRSRRRRQPGKAGRGAILGKTPSHPPAEGRKRRV